MPPVLTTASTVQCMHGGQLILVTTNAILRAGDSPVLLTTDVHPVVGCSFTPGGVYTPCVMVQWTSGAMSLAVNGAPVLLATSIGECLNAAGAPQGIAVVCSSEPELEAV